MDSLSAPRRPAGFSLVEMAVVLTIVTLLLGGMLLPMSAQQDMRQRTATQKSLSDIQEALSGYAAVNGRLPRPATSASNGAENPTLCADDAACTGFIPWATLGVDKVDAWNKLLRYSVTPDFANASITLTTLTNRTVQTRDSAGTLTYLAGQANCNSTTSPCIAAVIFSHGNYRWGTTENGAALADGSTTNTDEDANHNGPLNYVSRTPTAATGLGGEFDDLVVWLPPHTLISRLIAAGRLP